ncbi:class I histocompatibility antigen, F10 alpha chain-like [Heptranchias perlo]|uniref:class I histocompatibility antigen, F10 alpha chain-like n=1 Tax=Heptranchias perlo TaxID=212740 RepID=UPI00355A939F
MIGLIVLVVLCGGVSAGSHSLRYFFTSMTPIPGFPEFVVVGYVDEAQFVEYNSERRTMIPRQRWMEESEGPEYWEGNTRNAQISERTGKVAIEILSTRTNQSGGIHTYQRMYGCDLGDDGTTRGFVQYAWDGEDLINFDKDQMVWVTPVQWGEITKNKWDQNKAMKQGVKGYLEGTCIEWLRKYLEYGKRELMAVTPQVFLSVDKASDTKPAQLSCLVTGFYPRDIELTLLRNGRPISDTDSTGILPNHDGTYQIKRWVEIGPEDGATYSCQVDHSSKAGVETRDWDGTFRVTPGSSEGPNLGLIVGIVLAAVVLIALVIGAVVWKKRGGEKKSGYSPANPAERGESSSNSSARA